MAAGLGGNGENSRYNSISHCSVVVVKYHDQRQHKKGGIYLSLWFQMNKTAVSRMEACQQVGSMAAGTEICEFKTIIENMI